MLKSDGVPVYILTRKAMVAAGPDPDRMHETFVEMQISGPAKGVLSRRGES